MFGCIYCLSIYCHSFNILWEPYVRFVCTLNMLSTLNKDVIIIVCTAFHFPNPSRANMAFFGDVWKCRSKWPVKRSITLSSCFQVLALIFLKLFHHFPNSHCHGEMYTKAVIWSGIDLCMSPVKRNILNIVYVRRLMIRGWPELLNRNIKFITICRLRRLSEAFEDFRISYEHLSFPQQTVFVAGPGRGGRGILFSRCPSIRDVLVFQYLEKRQWWNFIKFGKHIDIHKMNIYNSKIRARAQFF